MIGRLSVFLLFPLVVGCATSGGVVRSEQESAREEFEEGLRSLRDGYYQEALDKFNQVKSKYPFSRYAVEAELKIGDTYFEDEKYPDAAEAYLEFIKLHPTNPLVDYAAFRVGLAYFRDAPSDWFFLPPAYEKDQSSNLKARDAFIDFLSRYKGSRYEREVRDYLDKVNRKLVEHDIYIAKFYLKRKKYEACEHRVRSVIDKYGLNDGMDEALYLLGYSLYLQKKDGEYKKILDEMDSRFPKSRFLHRLRSLKSNGGRG